MKRLRKSSLLSPTLVPYLLAFSISWTFTAALILTIGNGTLFLFINSVGTWYTDQVASTLTWLGDGTFYALVCLVLLVYNRVHGLAALVSFGLSSVVANLLKHLVFSNWDRPASFFSRQGIAFRQPEGFAAERWLAQVLNPVAEAAHLPLKLAQAYPLHNYHSFPSGHAVSAFSLACLLAFYFPKPKLQVFFLLMAWLVGLSRVLLAQHFPFDILGAALIGTLCSVLVRDFFFKYGLAQKVMDAAKPPADASLRT